MTKQCSMLTIGYDLSMWQELGIKEQIVTDISTATNSHILICGMSGSGKSYAEIGIFARIVQENPDCECYFGDYKQEDYFKFLRNCPRYFPYRRTIEALDIVYDKLQKRQSGEIQERYPIVLLLDEYVANVLALLNEDKKIASSVMNKVAEILMLGRSLNVNIFTTCQRPDAVVFPSGSRLNYGIVLILGASNRGIYEMLIPDHMETVKDREFKQGEGVLLLQGSELHFIKIPTIQNDGKLKELCIKALS